MAQTMPPPVEWASPPSGDPPVGRRWAAVAIVVGVLSILSLMTAGLIIIPRYQAAHPMNELQRSDANRVSVDDLYLDLTLVTPEFFESRNLVRYIGGRDPASVLPVLVGVNTHTGNIAHMHHLNGPQGNFRLEGPDGRTYPALTEPIVLTAHHNAYMLLFPARDHHGAHFLDMRDGALTILAQGMGQVAERQFVWDLPLEKGVPHRGWLQGAMFAVALLSALIVVLSPCALELSLYYLSIITASVSEGYVAAVHSPDAAAAPRAGRRQVMINLASFVTGFTLLYAFSGATVGLVGQGVRQPLGEYSTVIQFAGGGLLLFFALRVLGLDRFILSLIGVHPAQPGYASPPPPTGLAALVAVPRRWFGRLRQRADDRAARGEALRARDSFLVGIGLSSSCLTCMGGAVLYPLMVYAGITSWYSGFITLGLYSLCIAVPMVFISLGIFRFQMSFGRRARLNRVVRVTSGLMLAGIAFLVLSGNERAITDVAFSFIAEIARWTA